MSNLMKKLVIVFDLDGTLIDSSHRISFKEDGSFDLDEWINKSIYEHIKNDTLLPLYHLYKELRKTGHTIIAVTARELKEGDYKYFEENDLIFDKIIHRGSSKELDEVLKDRKMKEYFEENGFIPYMAFDDKEENLEIFDNHGFRTFQANYMNKKLDIGSYEPTLKPKNC